MMEVKQNEPMSAHTTFRVGGPAAWFVIPETCDEMREAVKVCDDAGIPRYILGNGSNLLVSDAGFDGVIVSTEKLNDIMIDGTSVTALAGALLSKIANEAFRNSLTGFEFASGIPGSAGGAAIMNAGAYGCEMKDVISNVYVFDEDLNIRQIGRDELEMGYRTSLLMRKGYPVISVTYQLERGDPDGIKALMDDLAARRREKQPLDYPSAGSTFKRPEGYFAGKLIEDAGLKGMSVGGARVSEKHAGFVINRGDATAADIYELCKEVSEKVKETSGVTLEMEVKILGEF